MHSVMINDALVVMCIIFIIMLKLSSQRCNQGAAGGGGTSTLGDLGFNWPTAYETIRANGRLIGHQLIS